jgi:hypothetical protein
VVAASGITSFLMLQVNDVLGDITTVRSLPLKFELEILVGCSLYVTRGARTILIFAGIAGAAFSFDNFNINSTTTSIPTSSIPASAASSAISVAKRKKQPDDKQNNDDDDHNSQNGVSFHLNKFF